MHVPDKGSAAPSLGTEDAAEGFHGAPGEGRNADGAPNEPRKGLE